MKNKARMAAALAAVSLCLTAFAVPAYAHGNDVIEETQPPETAAPKEPTAKPFTPAGGGTVMDNATGEDGKEFYTIKTPDENVFYLVIDRQRTGENVYFLNAVTEQDLLSLAKKDGKAEPAKPAKPQPEPEQKPAPETKPEQKPSPQPEQKQGGGSLGTILLVLAVAAIGGGAGWYFKIYRPKHGIPELDEAETGFESEADPDGDGGELPDWNEEEPEQEGQEDEE